MYNAKATGNGRLLSLSVITSNAFFPCLRSRHSLAIRHSGQARTDRWLINMLPFVVLVVTLLILFKE